MPEIDLSKDGFPDFGYIPEKWSKDTSRLFSKWAPVKTSALEEYQIGVGMNNMSNGITEDMVGGAGWLSAGKDNFLEVTNLSLLASKVTRLSQSIPFSKNPPFDINVDNGDVFPADEKENGQINVGSEIMGYSSIIANQIHITKRGESYGVARQDHLVNERVTNDAYIVRARAIHDGRRIRSRIRDQDLPYRSLAADDSRRPRLGSGTRRRNALDDRCVHDQVERFGRSRIRRPCL